MDFFGILFDMKNGKKIPYSKTYFDTLLAENLSGVTTLTGTLPLTFTTSETALRSWTIYGADIEHVETASGKSITFHTDEDKLRDWSINGNDNAGKNIFEIIPADQIITETGTLSFATDAESGMITANGTTGSTESNVKQRFIVTSELAGDYYFSGSFNRTGSVSTFDAYMYDETARGFIKKWDGTTTSRTIKGTESQEVKLIEGHTVELTIRVFKNTSVDNLVFKPMLRKADTTADFEPYQVGVGQKKTTVIVNTDLEQGYTGTDTSKTYEQNKRSATNRLRTASLIAVNRNVSNVISINDGYEFALRWYSNGLFASYTGWNTYYTIPADFTYNSFGLTIRKPDSSDITNAESITITIQEQVYSIPLTVNSSTQDIYIGSTPLTAGQSVSKASTGVDIATADGNNTITTSLYNKPDMSITYNDFTGVGIPIANLFMIALKLVAGGQTLNVFNTLMNKPLRAGETLTSEQTGQTINTVAGVENKLSPAPKVASYGGSFDMTIKYKE